jgi:uncharacterized protein (TIGR03435 family)
MRETQVSAISILLAMTFSFPVSRIYSQNIAIKDGPATSSVAREFDVVSIRENTSGASGIGYQFTDDGLRFSNAPILMLMMSAYGFRDDQIQGLPHWAESVRFDLVAKMTDSTVNDLSKLSPEQQKAMLASVLTSRFNLRFHMESRVSQILSLTLASGGVKLEESSLPVKPGETVPQGVTVLNRGDLVADAMTMPSLAKTLSGILSQDVVDHTALAGTYKIRLKWSPEDGPIEAEDRQHEASSPSLFTALKEQLGLKLLPGKGPTSKLIIDNIEHPSAN